MIDLLFDTPWWLPVAIIAAGVTLFLGGNKRLETRMRNAGLAVAGVGLLLALISYLVDTDKEKVIDRSRQLVQAVVAREWQATEALLDPAAAFTYSGLSYGDRKAIIEAAQRGTQSAGLSSATVTDVGTQRIGSVYTTSLRIFSVQEKAGGIQTPSDWELDWKKTDQGWVVIDIRLIQFGKLSPEAAKQNLPAAR